ncbi:ATP-binding protein [Aeoliella sp. SH292]|uniref:hybrid sensor histidine kinase/response regulator n=1 Tax=Aeoliella sp. SH292 TaxID=3454464 RepID=UPI003F9AB593
MSVLDFLYKLFDTSDFPARWNCGHWTTGHGWLHILSDIAVWGAYTSIPVALVVFAKRRRDVPFKRIYLLFAAFILACGSVHLVEAIIFWQPIYRFSGLLKLLTAIVSWATVIALVRIAPQAMEWPGLKTSNDALRDEVERRERSEERLRLATQLAGVGAVDIDYGCESVRLDRMAGEQYDLPTNDWISMDQFLSRCHPADRETLLATIQSVSTSESREVLSVDHRVIHTDGGLRWLNASMQPASTHSEGDRGDAQTLVAVIDKTERMRREELLAKAKAEADAANQARGEFLANMSHEIRTPMAALMGHADILLAHLTDPDNRQCALTIKRSGNHLLDLINDILDLSRIEAGRMEVIREPCNLPLLLAEVESLMHVRVRNQRVDFRLTSSSVIPAFIESDTKRLKQVLLNLVGNALKFTEKGYVELRAVYDPHKGCVRIEVEDTGIGIPPSTLKTLFQPFHQGDASRTRPYGGSGLGLAISKRLVEMLGGHIDVQSVEGVGSTFTVTLPTPSADQLQLVPLTPSAYPRDDQPIEIPSLEGRILLVDDRRDIRYVGQHFLEEAGAEVETAENGKEALRLVQQAAEDNRPYGVIVMDMQMPIMDGHTAVSELRAMGCEIPIIALTADAMKEDRERCLNSGCDDYLPKPIAAADLVKMVATYLEHSSLEEVRNTRELRKAELRNGGKDDTIPPA